MIRIVEILVAVNAACGIAAFLLARGAIKRIKRELGLEEGETKGELPRGEVQ
jgi:hypothetical protein